jgi:monooxygenase
VKRATWDASLHYWKIEYIRDNVEVKMKCRFLFLCTGIFKHLAIIYQPCRLTTWIFFSGYYSYESGYTPVFEGSENFKGPIIHPQFWPKDLNYANKKVVVIGSGATAITLIPSLLTPTEDSNQIAAHVTMLQRSPSYIVAAPSEDPFAARMYELFPQWLAYQVIRIRKIFFSYMMYTLARKYPKETKKSIMKDIQDALGPDYDVNKHFAPKYNAWDQRLCLCPNGDFFNVLKNKTASVVTDEIDCFNSDGIKLKSGEHLEADIIVTATGLNLLSLGGIEFKVNGQVFDLSKAFVYKGCMLSGLPNMGWWVGYTNASYTLKSDLTSYYFSRLINYMDRMNYTSCVPTPKDPDMPQRPLLTLTSNYMQRSRHLYPKQSLKAPWSYNNNYFVDWYVLCFGAIRNKELLFDSLDGGPDE